MIDIFTGKPGSGKTYRAVYDAYKLRKSYFIIHNIDGLKDEAFHYVDSSGALCEHCVSLESVGGVNLLQNYIQFEQFCTNISNTTSKKILFILDECYIFLDKDYPGIKETLAKHRHTGSDIWLIAQHMQMIALSYRRLIRFEYRCLSSGLFSFFGVFIYSHRQEGEGFSVTIRPKKHKIYDLYCSALAHTKNTTYIVPVCAALLLPCTYYAFETDGIVRDYLPKKTNAAETRSAVQSAPVQPAFQSAPGQPAVQPAPGQPAVQAPDPAPERIAGFVGGELLLQRGSQLLPIYIAYPGCSVETVVGSRFAIFHDYSGKRFFVTDSISSQLSSRADVSKLKPGNLF